MLGIAMIQTFRDKRTEALFRGAVVTSLPPDILRVSYRKLKVLHNAASLHDLAIPPANRLEALRGKRQGQYSIRINAQWRICFIWRENNAYDAEIIDYH